MAGVESAEEMTNEHLNAMCGGELLRGEVSIALLNKSMIFLYFKNNFSIHRLVTSVRYVTQRNPHNV